MLYMYHDCDVIVTLAGTIIFWLAFRLVLEWEDWK